MSTTSNSLKASLTRDVLWDMAGDRYFARGEDYFRRGYVHDLAVDGDGLTAQVSGTEDYFVELWAENNQLHATCTCPLGVEDIFCKHCVAVGLSWLANPDVTKVRKGKKQPAQKPVTLEEVQHFLEQQDQSTLIQWMLDRTQQDENWKQQLFLKVASSRPGGIDLTTFRRALQNATYVRDLIEWNEVDDYADGIRDVLDAIQDLLEPHPQAVIELCEYAISLIETAMNSVDDSNGDVGMVLEDFQTLHYEACELAQPDPIALAERLFQGEMKSGFGSFSNAVETYASVLGEEGRTRYRELAEAQWQEFPPLSPRDAGEWNYKRRQLQRILETLAQSDNDIEAVVAIKRQDLSTPRTYLEIAQLYRQDGQPDRALEWAESGLNAFDRAAPGLQEFLIEEYHRRGRTEEAMELAWHTFTQSVSLYSYQKLKAQAERANQWATWRDRALSYIRQQLEPQAPSSTPPKATKTSRTRKTAPSTQMVRQAASYPARNPLLTRDRSLLVDIFLWEGEDEMAWQEAQTGGCSQQLWLRLAERRQSTHPEDALPIYQREVECLIQQTNNTAYANAIAFLPKVRDLMVRLDQQTEFNAFIDHLRHTYKAKRNFITLLNRQKW